jgi:hypothetical protein
VFVDSLLGEEEQGNPTIVGVEVAMAPLTAEPWVRSRGVIDGAFEVMRAAWWPKPEHLFSMRCPHLTALQRPPMLLIPIFALLVPSHQHSLSAEDRLACSAAPAKAFVGTDKKRGCCVGCRLSLLADPSVVWCLFLDDGFPFLDGSPACPCHSACHAGCFSAGPAFVSQ